MHGSVGLHSALAIKRQRNLRDQKRRQDRRFSSPKDSISGMPDVHRKKFKHIVPTDTAIASNIGMMHLGIIFLVLGIILLSSGMLSDNPIRGIHSGTWINELISSGIFAVLLGLFLLAVNRFTSDKEDKKLNEYVQNQLNRTKSGHYLDRDVITGGLKPRTNDNLSKHSFSGPSINFPIPHSPVTKQDQIQTDKSIPDNTRVNNDNNNNAHFSPITSDTRVLLDGSK